MNHRNPLIQRPWSALVIAGFLLTQATAHAAAPSTQLTVTGAVQQPRTHDATTLGQLPATTQSVAFTSGSGNQAHTYQGTSLWGVLNEAGLVTTPGVKNDVLNRYVLATGSDGYRVVYSLGEINPAFGNRPDLLAYAEQVGGQWTPLGADGAVRVTAPGDVKGGRYVSNLVNLDVRSSGSTQASAGGGVSTSFTVSGQVQHAQTFDLAALQALPSVTRTVGGNTYTGVSLWDLLNTTVGIATDPAVKNDILGMYVVATGSDGYKALFSMGEINPAFGNQPDIVAFSVNGEPLDSSGFARIVAPNDVKAGRYVSNLVSLEVFRASAVPEPGAVMLMLAGVLGICVRQRLPRKASQALTPSA